MVPSSSAPCQRIPPGRVSRAAPAWSWPWPRWPGRRSRCWPRSGWPGGPTSAPSREGGAGPDVRV